MTPRISPATGPFAKIVAVASRRQFGQGMVESATIYARNPRLTLAFSRFNRVVEKPVKVSKRLKDLAVLKTATIIECEFCIDIGSELARRAGISDAQLLALHRAHESGLFSDEELLVIDLATGMTRSPAHVGDATVAALQQCFGDAGVLELCHIIAWENHRTRLNVALNIGSGGFSDGKVCALPERAGLAQTSDAELEREPAQV